MTLHGWTAFERHRTGRNLPILFTDTLHVRVQYKYQGYFYRYSIKVTICVTGACGPYPPKRVLVTRQAACRDFREPPLPHRAKCPESCDFSRTGLELGNVPTTGRSSGQREDHHPRAVAASDQGAEGKQLSLRQRLGEAQLPY